ncbi:hypothetical protein GC163_15885 [bacterium]|nr:hypothetical protein [bacterium]
MFFRFAAAMALVVLISLCGTALDKEAFALRRRVSQQQYRLEMLTERHARMRAQAQRLGTPVRWLNDLDRHRGPMGRIAQPPASRTARTPLLNWTAPATEPVTR